jgi:lipopolysaccharide transport system ATP-binding protein
MSKVAIKFENISKQYRLGTIGTGTLSHDLNRWWITNILRKEDPYLKIGQVNDREAKSTSNYVWALRDINFEINKGEVLGIIGKNGAGKSTLLKILSHVTAPSTGRIMARGRIASLLEVGTGFHPEMTGRENIYMNGSIMGMSKAEITRKLDEIVDFAGVEKYIDTPVKRYSSGMTVRLGFAIAAYMEPEILVVDEVLAVGDADFQKKALGKMHDVSQKSGRTVLFVSHNMAAVKSLCTKGVMMNEGKIAYEGNVEDVINSYLHVNYFEDKKITDMISYKSHDLHVESIKINGTSNNHILLKSGKQLLEIEIEGILGIRKSMTVEFRLSDINDNYIAYYSPGHLYGELIRYPEGKFVMKESVLLPDNFNKGEIFMDLFLTNPNIEKLMIAPSCIKIETEGLPNAMGQELLYKDRGYLFLKRADRDLNGISYL